MPTNLTTFSNKPSLVMHVDLNSCFATIEQQADPYLRDRPIAVAAYNSPLGCIIAPSIQAKRHGVKVGMQVQEGQKQCEQLLVLPPETAMYRAVHLKLGNLFTQYTDDVSPKSIDEFVLDFSDMPTFAGQLPAVAQEIKNRIKQEIGSVLTVSIGIAPNRYLAKVAAGLRKPDGLDEINHRTIEQVLTPMKLTELTGIKAGNAARLISQGIRTPLEFLHASARTLKAAFKSIEGYYWFWRLHGHEVDDVEFGRKSYGNSYALPKSLTGLDELRPVLTKLVQKTGQRMRRGGHACRGVHVSLLFRDGSYWHQGITLKRTLLDSFDIYAVACQLLIQAPRKPIAIVAETDFNLHAINQTQLELFADVSKKSRLVKAIDDINDRWGNHTIFPARMIGTARLVPDRISFGSIKEAIATVHTSVA